MLDALAAHAPPVAPGAPAPTSGDVGGAGGFTDLLLGAAPAPTPPPTGQTAAADGKDLPGNGDEDANDSGDAVPGAAPPLDPMLLWLPVDVPGGVSLPASMRSPAGAAATARAAAGGAAAPPVVTIAAPLATGIPGATSLDSSAWQAVAPQRWDGPLPGPPAPDAAPPATTVKSDSAAPTAAEVSPPVVASPPSQPQPQPTLPAIQPARQAFAAAIALVDGDRPQRIARRSPLAEQPLTATLQALGATATAAIAATGDAQQAPFDLTRDADLGRMIDHIEHVRDQADAGDTRMRLSPDALGTVDVAVRRDGDRVHVQFTADQAATRSLLNDAQPRLQALADARGLKLGDASIAGGQSGHARQDRTPDRFAAGPRRNAVAAATLSPTEPAPDQRLA